MSQTHLVKLLSYPSAPNCLDRGHSPASEHRRRFRASFRVCSPEYSSDFFLFFIYFFANYSGHSFLSCLRLHDRYYKPWRPLGMSEPTYNDLFSQGATNERFAFRHATRLPLIKLQNQFFLRSSLSLLETRSAVARYYDRGR